MLHTKCTSSHVNYLCHSHFGSFFIPFLGSTRATPKWPKMTVTEIDHVTRCAYRFRKVHKIWPISVTAIFGSFQPLVSTAQYWLFWGYNYHGDMKMLVTVKGWRFRDIGDNFDMLVTSLRCCHQYLEIVTLLLSPAFHITIIIVVPGLSNIELSILGAKITQKGCDRYGSYRMDLLYAHLVTWTISVTFILGHFEIHGPQITHKPSTVPMITDAQTWN